jgi:hypothetical protein
MTEPTPNPNPIPPQHQSTDQKVYNIVSDTLIGANVRKKDNLYQALAIAICLFLGIAIGALVTRDRILGAVVGGFIGVLAGLFGSGFFLMIFRGIQHLRGRHE